MNVIGLVTSDGKQYRLTPLAATHLVPGQPMYAGDSAGVSASPVMWTGLASVVDAVRAGGSILPEHAETRHPFWETFAQASGSMAFGGGEALSSLLSRWMKDREQVRMLDIAAGSGIYGFTVAKHHPQVELTTLDWPNVLVETRKWRERLAVDEKRVRYLEGNLFEVDYGGPYDLILLSHVFHHFDSPTSEKLARKVAAALAPGGRVVVHDFLTDGGNPAGVMFSVTMLAWTKQGEAYASSGYAKWFNAAGLAKHIVEPAPGLPTTFFMAEK